MNTLQITKGYRINAFLKDIIIILNKNVDMSENDEVNENKNKHSYLVIHKMMKW